MSAERAQLQKARQEQFNRLEATYLFHLTHGGSIFQQIGSKQNPPSRFYVGCTTFPDVDAAYLAEHVRAREEAWGLETWIG